MVQPNTAIMKGMRDRTLKRRMDRVAARVTKSQEQTPLNPNEYLGRVECNAQI